MKLEEYLKAIKECPDEQLTDEFGIYDNFNIFSKVDFFGFIKCLTDSNKYILVDKSQIFYGAVFKLNYVPGTVEMYVYQRKTDISKTRHRSLSGIYIVDMTIHPYQKKKIENVPWKRSIANVVVDIGQFLIDENIPTCMLNTTGWKYLDRHDDSLIVIHEPLSPVKSEYLRVKV
jgi:hypothetical protein